MSKITTVIFDMYETLVPNNRALWIETFESIIREQNLEISAEQLFEEWKALEIKFRVARVNLEEPEKSPPFKSYQTAWLEYFSQAFNNLKLTEGNAVAATRVALQDLGTRQPFSDALQVLPKMHSRWRTAVLSNADDAFLLPQINKFDWKFEAVLSSEDAKAYKPLPSPFLQMLARLKVGPEESIYVGDMLYEDVLGAKSVGMRAVWVSRNGEEPNSSVRAPDFTVHSLTELPAILESVS